MDSFVIEGGRRLEGSVRINGSKNASLPLMAASLLTDAGVTLRGVPGLADIRNMARLLDELGVEVATDEGGPGGDGTAYSLRTHDESTSHARYDIVRTMRASVCVLGPLLARRGRARVSMPGGCAIGQRPIDLHLRGLEALGAKIELDAGDVIATAPNGRLRGGTVFLGGPFGSTVLGTANVMSAATLAEGTTVIESAACEPEIADLAKLLNAMGARIEGAGSPRLTIHGVDALGGADHEVMPDRIEAATFMCASAITNGAVELSNCPLDAMLAVTDRLAAVGVRAEVVDDADPLRVTCRVTTDRTLQPVEVTTQPHPGFPTDCQAQLMALLVPRGREQRDHGEDLPRAVPARRRADADGRAASSPGRDGRGLRCAHADGGPGDGERPPRIGVPGARRARREGHDAYQPRVPPRPRVRTDGDAARGPRRGDRTRSRERMTEAA
jgi:UDP-N-acetylglucosamine 1-carboxyvinyltransferase